MKFSVLQQDLLPALNSVSRSCGVRSTLPVLANVLISAQGSKLKLSVTNLEVGVVKLVNAKVLEEGELTIPSRTFLEIVSSLESTELLIEAVGEQTSISTKKFNAKLNGISSNEFPAIPLTGDNPIQIDAKLLSQILPKIAFAAAADEGRPVLTGILTELKDSSLEMVATDGFRLSHERIKLSGESKQEFRALIPKKTLEELTRLIVEEGEVDKVEISTSENQIIFKVNSTALSSRLIEGQFPSWEKIIPTSSENRTIVDRVELLKAVKLASVFAKDSANIVKLESGKTGIKLTSEAKELGGQETEVEASVEGGEILIAFNSKFLLDALSATSANQVLIEFSGNLSPALIKPVGEEGLEYIVMPVRLS